MTDSVHDLPMEEHRSSSQLLAIVITVVVLATLLGGLFFWRSLRNSQGQGWQQGAVQVAAAVVRSRDVPASLDAVGTLTAVREVTLSPELAGRVSEIHFEAGEQVRAGALLVQLFDAPERADRDAARARAAFAETQLARSEKLAPSGAASRELLQQRRAERDQAVAAVKQIDALLMQKQIRAPFAGEIGIRRVNLGQYLNPGDDVATLTALDSLYVEFALPQQELARVKSGAAVSVTSDAYPGQTFAARVNAIEPRISEATRNVTVQALLANRDGMLRPGMYVTASLVLPPQKGALVVPTTAIQTSAQGNSVVVIRGDDARTGGTAEIVPVQTGRRTGDEVVIASGLNPGDVVVSEGQLRVQPGATVSVSRLAEAGSR